MKFKNRLKSFAVLALSLVLVGVAFGASAADDAKPEAKAGANKKPVVNKAKKAELAKKPLSDALGSMGHYKTLAELIKLAGLDETLKGKGPFTIFAPNDEAFKKMPQDQLDALKKDPEKLKKFLSLHIVSAQVTLAELSVKKSLKSLEGTEIPVKAGEKGAVLLNNHKVMGEIKTSNGLIHNVENVFLPKG